MHEYGKARFIHTSVNALRFEYAKLHIIGKIEKVFVRRTVVEVDEAQRVAGTGDGVAEFKLVQELFHLLAILHLESTRIAGEDHSWMLQKLRQDHIVVLAAIVDRAYFNRRV